MVFCVFKGRICYRLRFWCIEAKEAKIQNLMKVCVPILNSCCICIVWCFGIVGWLRIDKGVFSSVWIHVGLELGLRGGKKSKEPAKITKL